MVARDSGRPIFVPSSALDTKFAANICRAVKQWKTRENISALGNFSPHQRDAETLWEEKADGGSCFLNRHSPLSCLHVVGIRRPVCEKQGSCPSNTKWVGFAWFLRNQPRACYLLRFVWFAGRRRRLVYNLQNIEFNAPSAFANAHSEKMIWPVLDPNDVLISCFEKTNDVILVAELDFLCTVWNMIYQPPSTIFAKI